MKRLVKTICLSGALCAALFTGGCGNDVGQVLENKVIEDYVLEVPEFVLAERGDVEPVFSLFLEGVNMERKAYFSKYYDGMKIKEVHVSVGDSVSEGDVLVVFDNGDGDKERKEYEVRIEEDKLLLDHLRNLAAIDSDGDYESTIQEVEDEIHVTELYIKEIDDKKEALTVRAEGEGIVESMSDLLKAVGGTDGDLVEIGTAANQLNVCYGEGLYQVETDEDYDFRIGERFDGTYGMRTYPVEVVDIKETNGTKVLTFRGCDETINYSTRSMMYVNVKKKVLKDAICIPKGCLFSVNYVNYVYILNEEGLREMREVELEADLIFDEKAIIKSGISEGERVVVLK